MVNSVTTEERAISRNSGKFGTLYAAIVFLSLHWALVVYINSSFLDQYVSNTTIGTLYAVSAILTIAVFMSMSKILSRAGKHTVVLALSLLEVLVMLGMAFAESANAVIVFFVIHQTIVPLIFFNMDIYMEELIGEKESNTGSKRGLLLAIISAGYAATALAAGYLLGDGEPQFTYVYIGSALLMLPFIIIMMTQFSSSKHKESQVNFSHKALSEFWKKKDLRNVFGAHFLLQVFFAWTVIYSPLYLATVIGLNWVQIGQILFFGLLAYVIFEYPIGIMADKWLGEKELMSLGFLIVAVSISWFLFIQEASIIPWMLVMFLSRVGASLIEVTTESYFFKHTKGNDIDMISFFRATRPISYIVGAGLGSLMLYFFDFNIMFLGLSALMIIGFFFAMALHDTK